MGGPVQMQATGRGLQLKFGVPTDLLTVPSRILDCIPSHVLGSISEDLEHAVRMAQEVVREITREVLYSVGIIEFPTDRGDFRYASISSEMALSTGDLGALGDVVGYAAALAAGAIALLNTADCIGSEIDRAKDLFAKLGSFGSMQKGAGPLADQFVNFNSSGCLLNGSHDPSINNEEACNLAGGVWDTVVITPPTGGTPNESQVYEEHKFKLKSTLGFIQEAQAIKNRITTIISDRMTDPDSNPEPVFDGCQTVDGIRLDELLLDTNLAVSNSCENKGYCSLGQKYSDVESCEAMGGVWTAGDDEVLSKLPQEKFYITTADMRTPPISTKGKFILSKKGLYYDLEGGGFDMPDNLEDIVECSSIVPSHSMKWMFDYDPNCKGKGEAVSLKDFTKFANSIVDYDSDFADIDNSPAMQEYYSNDTFLCTLIDARNKHVYDSSAYITELMGTGDYTEDSALIVNQRQQLYTDIASHSVKIKKRKKQIQTIAILGFTLNEDGDKIPIKKGTIPINDFSLLDAAGISLAVERQQTLAFSPGEVSSVVLPLNFKPTVVDDPHVALFAEYLHVPDIGTGGLPYQSSSVSGTVAHNLATNDQITTDGLLAVYNFLDTKLVAPDADDYNLLNSVGLDSKDLGAQLVASSLETVFPSGLGIPWLGGVCTLFSGTGGSDKAASWSDSPQYLRSPRKPYGYVKLPEDDRVDSLLYKNSGFSFETWLHVPDLTTSSAWGTAADGQTETDASSLFRLVLSNENRGGAKIVTDENAVGYSDDSDTIKGLIVGFTRDRRITQDGLPSNTNGSNQLEKDGIPLKFSIIPTMSVNTSCVSFISKTNNVVDCQRGTAGTPGYYHMSVDASDGIGDVSSSFKLVTITGDPLADEGHGEVSIYLDGVLLKSQNYLSTFGRKPGLQIPSPVAGNSFHYRKIYATTLPASPISYHDPTQLGWADFWYWNGPQGSMFTPWIIGGGYTDGMTTIELGKTDSFEGMNFLGTEYGGITSGLKGFVGSVKLYNKALVSSEILKNFNAQKGFFNNIVLGGG